MRYFVSDLHFGHKNILKFERRQFDTIEEHDEYIITSINKVVKPTDELYILGDVGNVELVARLHGRKYLVLGNHDKQPQKLYEMYFAEVYDTPIYLTQRVVLSHHPIPVTQGVLNSHGHLHGSYLASDNHWNLSIAMVDYKPVGWDRVGSKVGQLVKDNHTFLEEWYVDLYRFVNAESRNDIVVDHNGRLLLKETKEHRKNFKKDEKGFVVECFKEPEIHAETGLPLVQVMNIIE